MCCCRKRVELVGAVGWTRHFTLPQAGHSYGEFPVALVKNGPEMPLLQYACSKGFWDLPTSFLKQLCDLNDWAYPSASVCALLQVLCEKILPMNSSALMEAAFLARIGAYDGHEGLAEIINLEWVSDVMDGTVSDEVRSEVTKAKAVRAMRVEFVTDVTNYKESVG